MLKVEPVQRVLAVVVEEALPQLFVGTQATVATIESLTPEYDAPMLALPGATPVITPVVLTLTAPGLELDQVAVAVTLLPLGAAQPAKLVPAGVYQAVRF